MFENDLEPRRLAEQADQHPLDAFPCERSTSRSHHLAVPRAISGIPPTMTNARFWSARPVRSYQYRRPGPRYLSLMRIRVELTVPAEFRISMTPRRLLRMLVRTIFLPCLVGLSLTFAVSPAGMLVMPAANWIRLGAFVDAGSLDRAALRLTKKSIWTVH